MTPPPIHISDILSRLTEAQRRALMEACGGPDLFVTRWKHGRSVGALQRLGLTNAPPPGPGGIIAVLTARGIEVRNILLREAASKARTDGGERG